MKEKPERRMSMYEQVMDMRICQLGRCDVITRSPNYDPQRREVALCVVNGIAKDLGFKQVDSSFENREKAEELRQRCIGECIRQLKPTDIEQTKSALDSLGGKNDD